MARKTRNTLVLAKLETTLGTDAVPTGAADAILAIDPAVPSYTFNNIDRNIQRGFLGASEQLVGVATVQLEFGFELVGSGTAGTAPAWGKLLQACGMAQVVTAGSHVSYNPVSTGFQGVTIYYFADGALHSALGCMGTAQLTLDDNGIPLARVTYTGIYGGVTVVSNPTPTLTAWQTPQVVSTENSGLVTLGGTLTAGAITGGTGICSRGLSIDLGNSVNYTSMLGPCSGTDIADRASTGSMVLDLTAAEEAAAYTAVKANTTTSIGLSHGTTAGRRVSLFAPRAQRINPAHQDVDGRLLMGFDLRLIPVTGNDEVIVTAY
jgi:hypothetical protein